MRPRAIFHAKLHDGVGVATRARVAQPHRLHRSEAQRLAPAARHLLDGHAPLEVRHLVELVAVMLVGRDERVDKRLILLARERAVDVCALVAAPRPIVSLP